MARKPGESEADAFYREAREALERRKAQWTAVFILFGVVCGVGFLFVAYIVVMVVIAINSQG
jgi:hypothetical protein